MTSAKSPKGAIKLDLSKLLGFDQLDSEELAGSGLSCGGARAAKVGKIGRIGLAKIGVAKIPRHAPKAV